MHVLTIRAETKIVEHSNDFYAPVSYLKILSFNIVKKEFVDDSWKQILLNIPIITTQNGMIIDKVPDILRINSTSYNTEEIDHSMDLINVCIDSALTTQHLIPEVTESMQILSSVLCNGSLSISGLVSDYTSSIDFDTEVTSIFRQLLEILTLNKMEMKHVFAVTVYCSQMGNFRHLNKVYQKYFAHNPPTRITIGIQIPNDKGLQMDIIASKSASNGLHVQSISYWAPANIGPYSQAKEVDGLLHLAGQIGLLPESMELHTDSRLQARQILTNIMQILRCWPEFNPNPVLVICYLINQRDHDSIRKIFEKDWKNVVFVYVKELPRSANIEIATIFGNGETEMKILNSRFSDDYLHVDRKISEVGSARISVISFNADNVTQNVISQAKHYISDTQTGLGVHSRVYYLERFNSTLISSMFANSCATFAPCHHLGESFIVIVIIENVGIHDDSGLENVLS